MTAQSSSRGGNSPQATADAYDVRTGWLVTSEDAAGSTALRISVTDLLANDAGGAARRFHSVQQTSANGAAVSINPDGTLSYDPGAIFDRLAADERATDTFTYSIQLGNGVTSTASVTLLVTGANDAPTVDVLRTNATGTITERPEGSPDENTAVQASTGSIGFADVDLSDTHTASFAPAGSDYLGALTLGDLDPETKTVAWTFTARDDALDGLAAGETRTQTYAVTIDDGHGGTATQNVVVTLVGSADGAPTILDFENLKPAGNTFYSPFPSNYEGFQWKFVSNAFDGDRYIINPSGYQAGVVSGDMVAVFSSRAEISREEEFDLEAGSFTAAWNDGQLLTVSGYRDGVMLGTQTFVINSTGPTRIEFDDAIFDNVDRVTFLTSGGTDNPNYAGAGPFVAMDDLWFF